MIMMSINSSLLIDNPHHHLLNTISDIVTVFISRKGICIIHVGWPLYRRYGHAYEAFKLIVVDPDTILFPSHVKGKVGLIFDCNLLEFMLVLKLIGTCQYFLLQVTKVVPALTDEVKDDLIKNIRRRMTPQPMKIRANIEMKCFQFDGVLHIKEAMRIAEASGNDDCPFKIKLVSAPLYVLTTQTLDKFSSEQGIRVLTDAIEACTRKKYRKLNESCQEVNGDYDSEEEDTRMGEIDVEGPSGVHEQ
ncbi:hypothetical protein MKX03_010892 [Papaver bracteatum]|nr:hypothetical protein MKX03_010892 [Papaver bracteatum]